MRGQEAVVVELILKCWKTCNQLRGDYILIVQMNISCETGIVEVAEIVGGVVWSCHWS